MSLINNSSAFEVTTSFVEQIIVPLRGRVENLAAFDLGDSLDVYEN